MGKLPASSLKKFTLPSLGFILAVAVLLFLLSACGWAHPYHGHYFGNNTPPTLYNETAENSGYAPARHRLWERYATGEINRTEFARVYGLDRENR